VAANENAEREVNTMKILLKNMEDSKTGEMKKYKESIMKENERIQVIKEGLYMEIEDMHAKSAEVFQRFTKLNIEFGELKKENSQLIQEIDRLKSHLEGETNKKEDTQETLERTQCILSEFETLYDMQAKSIERIEKQRVEMDKNIRKMERENKKKEGKIKELNELKEKLRINEQKLEEFQDLNNKTFADKGCQPETIKLENQLTQTEMTLNKIESLEQNLKSAKQETTKYLKVVKDMASKFSTIL
jgi:chromosome segregation ATPase